MRLLRSIAIGATALAACTSDHPPLRGETRASPIGSAGVTGVSTPSVGSQPSPSGPQRVGPLAERTWPAGRVRAGALLHDDGRRLLRISLDGRREVLWEHPPAEVYEVAASPDGERLAYAVELPGRSADEDSFVLYLLDSDGSIEVVDVVRDFRSIESPVFLRPPTEPDGPDRLYWVEGSEVVDRATGRLEQEVIVLGPEGPATVTVPLRYTEAPWEIYGYPGAATFTLEVFRQNDIPTRLQVTMNDDYFRSTDASLTLWGNNEPRLDTDSFAGVAWVTPREYVVPMYHEQHPARYSLRLLRQGCEYLGSHVLYQGGEIDPGYQSVPWRILPAGPHRVLVLGRAEASKVVEGQAESASWMEVDVKTGRIAPTGARWEPGPWTWVSPGSNMDPPAGAQDCADLTWTWP